MAQSRLTSLTEALTNVVLGLALALATQMALYPGFGIRLGFWEHLRIASSFTLLSLARSYLVRRFFNAHGEDG
ncbi:MAG: hypothetical protein U1E48_12690 [Paracoccaceae bacterium]